MASSPAPVPPHFPRRTVLGASAALVLLVAACTDEAGEPSGAAASGEWSRHADALARQVTVQEGLVAAYAAAGAADAALGGEVADLAAQAGKQLDRLRAAAPAGTATASAGRIEAAGPPPGTDARTWLRAQVSAAAASHAGACLEHTGARAALLGSLAASLLGQQGRLA